MLFNLFKNKKKELAKARNKLIHDLENKGIKNLIKQMDCDEPYSVLIRKQQLEGSYSSSDDISTYAYKVSENLKDPAYKIELLKLLDDPKYQSYKKYIFCCLASLCSNINDYELLGFLLNEIENENDESIVVSVLSRLDKIIKPINLDIRIIKNYLLEGTNNTRRAAIKALCNCEDSEVEDLLLNEFKVSDIHTKAMICIPLQSVGTKKSISVLETAYKQTRTGFLRLTIENTISEINKSETRVR